MIPGACARYGLILWATAIGSASLSAPFPAPQHAASKSTKGGIKRTDILGSYIYGELAGVKLQLKTDGSFLISQWTDLGTPTTKIYKGRFDLSSDVINMHGTRMAPDDVEFKLSPCYYPIKWGGRSLLVSQPDILFFVECTRRKWKLDVEFSLTDSYFFQSSTGGSIPSVWKLPGMPDIPKRFRRYLTTPFRARVTSIHGGEVRLDKGSADALSLGTELWPEADSLSVLRVVSLARHSAIAKRLAGERLPPPGVGTILHP